MIITQVYLVNGFCVYILSCLECLPIQTCMQHLGKVTKFGPLSNHIEFAKPRPKGSDDDNYIAKGTHTRNHSKKFALKMFRASAIIVST